MAGTGTLVPPPELNFLWPPHPPGGRKGKRQRKRDTERVRRETQRDKESGQRQRETQRGRNTHRERPITHHRKPTAGTSLVVQCKYLLCNAGDAGSIPAGGIKIPHATEQLSPYTPTSEPTRSGAHVPHQKIPHATTKMKIPSASEFNTETPTKNLNLFKQL